MGLSYMSIYRGWRPPWVLDIKQTAQNGAVLGVLHLVVWSSGLFGLLFTNPDAWVDALRYRHDGDDVGIPDCSSRLMMRCTER